MILKKKKFDKMSHKSVDKVQTSYLHIVSEHPAHCLARDEKL